MPGCGNGTLVMTVLRNQSMPRSWASLFTPVGLRRVSIGPPISVIDVGTKGSRRASMIETAATTGTEGWHTAMTWVLPPRTCSISMT